ncbi:MAG: putative transporter, partial [Herbinix sp.]|nr:putative transporter [Herbinix sp.]
GRIVDSIATGEDFLLVVFYVYLLFGTNYFFTAINTLLSKSREYLFIKLTNKLDNEINQKCMNIDFEHFNDSSIQDRILLINQAVRGNNFFTSLTTVFETISRFITLVGIVFIMTTLNVWLLAIALVVIVLQALLHYIRLKYDRKYKADSISDQRKIGYVSQLAKDIKSKKDIVMFDMSDYILKKIESFQQAMLVFDKRRIQVGGFIEMAIYTLSIAFQISAYILIGINAFNRTISIGDFTMGIASLINFMSASSFVATNIINFNDSFFYIKQYKSFQKFKSKYNATSDITINDIDLNNIEIEFRNVSFRYPNSTSFVLKNINLTIKNKERLAIVGFNGAGKTSFALLLTRMYDPTEGSILLNGIDIRRINYKDYQKIFSAVNQDFSLLAFSLLNNIAMTDTETQEERDAITELFHKNGMTERLKKLYRGLDTPVTKTLSASGVDISGGERQKVAIIRALYKDSPVLILDEPTSALDPVAEYEIYQKFAEMSEDKLTIFISHRIYSTRFCDKIAVFSKGEIVEYGTFEELQEQKGIYYDFFQKQAEYFK